MIKKIKVHDNGEISIAEVFRRAARRLERVGLAFGTRKSSFGAMCALGALDDVVTGEPQRCAIDKTDVPKILADTLELPNTNQHVIGTDAWRVADWSNGSSLATVVAGLNRAADKLDRRVDSRSRVDSRA